MRRVIPAPNITLSLIASLAALALVFSFYYVSFKPWLGLSFTASASDKGLIIAKIHRPALNNDLDTGDIVTILGRDAIPLNGEDLIRETNRFKGYDAYNAFLDKQDVLWQQLTSRNVDITLEDGRVIKLTPQLSRTVSSLPLHYWLLNLIAISVLLIVVTVWIYRPGLQSTRILAVAGIAFSIAAYTTAIYSSRELALPASEFRLFKSLNVLGVMVFGYSIVLLLWHYPSPIRRVPYLSTGVYATVLLVWLAETLQWTPPTGMYKYLLVHLLVMVFGFMQWRRSRSNLVQRAALSWLLLTITISITLAVLFYYLPLIYRGEALTGISTPFILVFILFLGMSMGVVRYRLFDLEKWWLEVWLWIASGVFILLFDGLLFYIVGLSPAPALALAVISAGWFYFPLRQWLLRRLLQHREPDLGQYLPIVMNTLFKTPLSSSDDGKLIDILRQVFQPLDITLLDSSMKTTIGDNGLQMCLPAINAGKGIRLASKYSGRQLFSSADARLADSLRQLTLKAIELHGERERGASLERKRIMRDLHDDVAAQLLALVHEVDEDKRPKVRRALHALRETIYSLDDDTRIRLPELLEELQINSRMFIDKTSIEIEWIDLGTAPSIELNSRQKVNISRIVQEALHNVIKHSDCTHLRVTTETKSTQFLIKICNNGVKTHFNDWIAGKGLNNIRNRAGEIQGNVNWTVEEGDCCFTLTLPLDGMRSNM